MTEGVKKFGKVLVANRGEVAVRVIRCLRDMGIASCAIHSTPDAEALHARMADEAVHIGPAHPARSYLDIQAIIEAAKDRGADAIHPGYGFLAENWRFAAACEEAGIVFIGPPSKAVKLLGDKNEARRIAASQGVPLIPGAEGPLDPAADPARAAEEIGYPLLVKAALGGGGKGMRVVRDESGIRLAVEAARRESGKAFGDSTVFLEKLIEKPRHVEIQLLGDGGGRYVHLFDRECSLQRRNQKLVEEAPSPALSKAMREEMAACAVAVAKSAGCTNACTVEFLLDRGGGFHFLEVNTRMQVEHPVTEMVTGVDIVQEQILIAMGMPLSFSQGDLSIRGHALECRIMAEDPARDFAPCPGKILFMKEPAGPFVRVDSGVEQGAVIPVEYDPILSKVITFGSDREAARSRMSRALGEFVVLGTPTTVLFLKEVIEHPAFAAAKLHTGFLDEHFAEFGSRPGPLVMEALVAAVARIYRDRDREESRMKEQARPFDPWKDMGNWKLRDS